MVSTLNYAQQLWKFDSIVGTRRTSGARSYALKMTGNSAVFITAMKRLAAQNLAEEQPSRLVDVLFHSDSSTHARIAAVQRWAADQPNASG